MTSVASRSHNVTSLTSQSRRVTPLASRSHNVTSLTSESHRVTSLASRSHNVTSLTSQGHRMTPTTSRSHSVTFLTLQSHNVTSLTPQNHNNFLNVTNSKPDFLNFKIYAVITTTWKILSRNEKGLQLVSDEIPDLFQNADENRSSEPPSKVQRECIERTNNSC